ncbi:MAG: penicillin-binding protein 2 [Calditerricola sp.]|nr:penicillin-binding protein 2 [Calditerricola sp.]
MMDAARGWRHRNRLFALMAVGVLMWAVLLGRLGWIQVWAQRSFSERGVDLVEASVRQRERVLVLDTGRGPIVDRQGRPLTGRTVRALAYLPVARRALPDDAAVRRLAAILSADPERLARWFREAKGPVFWRDARGRLVALTARQERAVEAFGLPGLRVFSVSERYPEGGVARHVLGFLSQSPDLVRRLYEAREREDGPQSPMVGAAGLERAFDPFLQGVGPTTIAYFTDARGNVLSGLGLRVRVPDNPFYPLELVTTLDLPLQRALERVADRFPLRDGAIVVLDAKTAEVRAMVSRPTFDPRDPYSAGDAWRNRALMRTPPGSVFKIVVAAAALVEGVTTEEERFFCPGELGKYGFSCWKPGGHGYLTMAEGFAQSCNIVFAELAKRLGGERMERYARALGVVGTVGWSEAPFFRFPRLAQFPEEEAGQVYARPEDSADEGVLVQTAIGQRDVRLTPLSAANLVVTLLNGGTPAAVRVATELRYQTGTSFAAFAKQRLPEAPGISPYTAYRLRKLMRGVVEEGTGKALAAHPWKLAGKSGTAQAVLGQRRVNHHWFVGFGPVQEPRYAVAVLVRGQPLEGENQATRLFGEVMEVLAAKK